MQNENNQPLSLFCYALNRMLKQYQDLSRQLDGNDTVKEHTCMFNMELLDAEQMIFRLYLEIKKVGDEFAYEEPRNMEADFMLCLNYLTNQFEIDTCGQTFTSPINLDFIGTLKKAEELFDKKLWDIFGFIDEWESEYAHAVRMAGCEIERQIHESRLEGNYQYC